MNQATEVAALEPEKLQRHGRLVGAPVQFQDGSVFKVPAMPVGSYGDPLAKAVDLLSEAEVEVQALNAEQQRAVDQKLAQIDAHVEGVKTADVLDVHRAWKERLDKASAKLFRLQLEVVWLALSLNYNVDKEELRQVTTLRQVRQVSMILSGAPQADEMEEAMRIIRRAKRDD